MKLLNEFFGTLTEITNNKTGEPYPETDWRMRYAGRPGLIAVYASEHRAIGQKFIYFYPDDPNDRMQDWIRTSAGDLQTADDVYVLTTKNSIYKYLRNDKALPEDRKLLMLLNVGMQPDSLTTQNVTMSKIYPAIIHK